MLRGGAGTAGLNSMSRKEGEFTLLLDEQFDILWHSESLSKILGWGDLRGRNGTDFVHPDDLGLVLETMMQFGGGHEHQSLDPAMGPSRPTSGSSTSTVVGIRSRRQRGTTSTTRGFVACLCTCRRVHDRSDLTLAIEKLGSGAHVSEVLPIIARLADRSMGGAEVRSAIAWKQDERIVIATAADERPLDPRLADAARLVWTNNITLADRHHRPRRPDVRRRR